MSRRHSGPLPGPRPNRPVAADADALLAACEALEALGPGRDRRGGAVTLNRARHALGWGAVRTDRAYHDLLNTGRWRWQESPGRVGTAEGAYRPTEADLEAVRAGWGPAEEARRRAWQVTPARVPGTDGRGLATILTPDRGG